MSEKKLVSHAATVLHVADPKRSAEFYRDRLGFTITFEWGEPPQYIVTNRDDNVFVHFSKTAQESGGSNGAEIYIFAHDVDAIYEEFLANGVEITTPIGDRDYGMRDFDIRDLDGNMLSFAAHVSRIEANDVYVCEDVKKLENLHARTIYAREPGLTVTKQLEAFVENLLSKFEEGDPAAAVEIKNWHPELVGKDTDEIMSADFDFEHARQTIARAYGFKDWDDVLKRGSVQFDWSFEEAVDKLVKGEAEALKALIDSNPSLLKTRSPYGHRATLLNYAGSNGVETWRQKVPMNLPAIVEMLIEKGAEKNATANLYGGEMTTLELASTSAHPSDAGIMEELLSALK